MAQKIFLFHLGYREELVTIEGIEVWSKSTSYHNTFRLRISFLIFKVILWTWMFCHILVPYCIAKDIKNFSPLNETFPSVLMIQCNNKGTMMALLRSKKLEHGSEYGTCLEVWSLNADMQPDKLLFKDERGLAFINSNLLWLEDNLLYTVLVSEESLDQIFDRWERLQQQNKENPLQGDPRFGADNIGQFELRLWNNRLKQSITLEKGICGIQNWGGIVFVPLHHNRRFMLIDPENQWSIYRLLYPDPRVVLNLYERQRIFQICELENNRRMKIVKTLTVEGLSRLFSPIGVTPDDEKLVVLSDNLPTPLNLQMSREKLLRIKVIDLDLGSIYGFNVIVPSYGDFDVKLIGDQLRVIHVCNELINIKYFDLRGELVDQCVIPRIRINKLVKDYVFPVALSSDGKWLIVHGGKVGVINLASWTFNLLAEGIWIDNIVQWLDNGYVLVIWHKSGDEGRKYWGFLKVF